MLRKVPSLPDVLTALFVVFAAAQAEPLAAGVIGGTIFVLLSFACGRYRRRR